MKKPRVPAHRGVEGDHAQRSLAFFLCDGSSCDPAAYWRTSWPLLTRTTSPLRTSGWWLYSIVRTV